MQLGLAPRPPDEPLPRRASAPLRGGGPRDLLHTVLGKKAVAVQHRQPPGVQQRSSRVSGIVALESWKIPIQEPQNWAELHGENSISCGVQGAALSQACARQLGQKTPSRDRAHGSYGPVARWLEPRVQCSTCVGAVRGGGGEPLVSEQPVCASFWIIHFIYAVTSFHLQSCQVAIAMPPFRRVSGLREVKPSLMCEVPGEDGI